MGAQIMPRLITDQELPCCDNCGDPVFLPGLCERCRLEWQREIQLSWGPQPKRTQNAKEKD